MVEYADDWSLGVVQVGPGQYKLSLKEPDGERRIIEKHLTLTDGMKLLNATGQQLMYAVGEFR